MLLDMSEWWVSDLLSHFSFSSKEGKHPSHDPMHLPKSYSLRTPTKKTQNEPGTSLLFTDEGRTIKTSVSLK